MFRELDKSTSRHSIAQSFDASDLKEQKRRYDWTDYAINSPVTGQPDSMTYAMSHIVKGPPAQQDAAPSNNNNNYGGYSNYDPYAAQRAAAAAAAAEAARQARIRGEINAGYDQYEAGLNNFYPQIDANQNTQVGQLTNRRDTEQRSLDTKLQTTDANLAHSRDDVRATRKSGLSGLGQEFARRMQSGGLSLAARGAADSSAAGQMALALAGEQSNARAGLLGQASQQLGTIDQKELDAHSAYDTQKNVLGDWYETEKNNVLNQYQDLRTQIEREKAGANLERRTALANLSIQLAQNLSGKLGALQTQFANMSKNLSDNLLKTKPDIDTTAINQSFQAQPLQREALPGLAFGDQRPSGNVTVSPALAALKKRDEETSLQGGF